MHLSHQFRCFIFLLLSFSAAPILAQGHKITGRIVDAETLDPLPFAHVFIDQTTIGSVSDINGEYVLENVEDGDYKLVFSYVGYELFFKSVTINGNDLRASARLIPLKEMLQNIEVKGTRDKEWENQLRQFKRVFLGENEWADNCTIVNPWVLEFKYDKEKKKFTANASGPIEIENKTLGYRIECNLQSFYFDKKSYKISGLFKFEELNTPDAREAVRWTRNRKLAYQSSLRFLMKSIMDKHVSENGFAFFLDKRPETYTSHTGLFSTEIEKGNLTQISFNDRISPAGRPGYYSIDFPHKIEVHHLTQMASGKTYRDVIHPVSWIEVDKGPILVGENGAILNNEALVTSGELNRNRIANMLPLNYSPGSLVVVNYITKRNIAKRLQERAYLQTDKKIYYPDENIWFKVHFNYSNQSVKDSLSRVLYTEVIVDGSQQEVVEAKMLMIDSMGARGQFTVNKSWKPGRYYLRAYTSWMRNYTDEIIPYASVIISDDRALLKINSQSKLKEPTNDFTLRNPQTIGDTTALLLAIDSTIIHGIANCALTITPHEVSVNDIHHLKNVLRFEEDLPEGTLTNFQFPLEWEFSIAGRLTNQKKKPIQGQVSAIQGNMDSLYMLKTNRQGLFFINQLSFSDSSSFAFQAKNRKGKLVGQIELVSRPIASIKKLKTDALKIDTIRIAPKSVPVVAGIEVSKPKLVNTKTSTASADYILTSDDLEKMPKGISLISILPGRIPGLHFDQTGKALTFRGNSLHGTEPSEPLFIVDGIPMFQARTTKADFNQIATAQQQDMAKRESGQVAQDGQINRSNTATAPATQIQVSPPQLDGSTTDMVSHINVENVSRVEITTHSDTRYGSLGTNGVIAIYTKKNQKSDDASKTLAVYTVKGFSEPKSFNSTVNYRQISLSEYSPTWYWNPDIQLNSKTFTEVKFPALPKDTIFRLTIGGVTKSGVPVSGSFLISNGITKPLTASLDQHQK